VFAWLAVALGVASLVGCSIVDAAFPPGRSAVIGPDATAMVSHSGDALLTTSYRAECVDQDGVTVVDADPVRQIGAYLVITGLKVGDTRFIRDDIYESIDQKVWYHFDRRRFGAESSLVNGPELPQTELLLGGVVEATRTSPEHYRGWIDLGRARARATTNPRLSRLASGFGAGLQPRASFVAALDEQGRVRSFEYALQDLGGTARTVQCTMSDYGDPVMITPPPPDRTREATDAMYDIYP
jgi:hypothetical protein